MVNPHIHRVQTVPDKNFSIGVKLLLFFIIFLLQFVSTIHFIQFGIR